MPSLFSKEGHIELGKASKSHSTILFRSHKEYQLHQCTSSFLWVFCYQNLVKMCSNSSHKDLGRRKHAITYVGIDCNIDLMRTSLPPWDKNWVHQQFIFFFILSLKYWKEAFLLLPTILGNPKYFLGLFEYITPKSLYNWILTESGVFALKMLVVFSKLTHWLEWDSYSFMILFKVRTPILVTSLKRIQSSVKRRWEISGPRRLALTQFKWS